MALPSYGTLLEVRPEVLSADRPMVDMVNLAEVTGTASASRRKGLSASAAQRGVVDEPSTFFSLTYPTHEVRETLSTLALRLSAPSTVPGVILLESHYGAGKSHVMAAAFHALTHPEAAQAWAKQWQLPPLTFPAGARIIPLSLIERSSKLLWELLFEPLGKPALLKRDVPYPDGQTIQALLDDRPVILILDELERWYDALDANSQSRNRNFLQALSEVAMRDSRLTLVTSLLGEKPEPAETLRRVRPMLLRFNSPEDRLRILQFRMFNTSFLDPQLAAGESTGHTSLLESRDKIISSYCEAYAKAGLPDVDEYRSRMRQTWPFSPEFVDVLIKKIPLRGGFQNTRGTLRFLSVVVGATHLQRPLISSQDLPLKDENLFNMLSHLDPHGGEVVRRACKDNFEAVRDMLPFKEALFSALVFYSVADPSRPGLTEQELLLACLGPEVNRNLLKDSLQQIRKLAYNLHVENGRYVFQTRENPHARIHAVAISNRISNGDCEELVKEQLLQVWGAPERTALASGDAKVTSQMLREKGRRLRLLLSVKVLSPEERWKLQSLDPDRNLVILIEPHSHSMRGLPDFSIFGDDDLRQHARRIIACNILLESQPSESTSLVYREVCTQEKAELARRLQQLYGQHVQWNPPRPGQSGPQEYELGRIPHFSASKFLEYVGQECTSQPQVVDRIRALAPLFERRRVQDLREHLERTLGEPILLDDAFFFSALRSALQPVPRPFNLQNEQGEILANLNQVPEREVLQAIFVPYSPEVVDLPAEISLPKTHERVSATYEEGSRTVLLSWTYPSELSGRTWQTLVQRYSTVRGWKTGEVHLLDLDSTHSANRFRGNSEHFRDDGPFTPGECQYYYVFLMEDSPGVSPRPVLSQRVDVMIPVPPKPDKDVLDVSPVTGFTRFFALVEQTVMNSKNMRADDRIRKLEISIRKLFQHPKILELTAKLRPLPPGCQLETHADVQLELRGELDRQQVLTLIKGLERLDSALYSARLHLKTTQAEG